MIRRPPRSTRTDTLFPYTTLFRTRAHSIAAVARRRGTLEPIFRLSLLLPPQASRICRPAERGCASVSALQRRAVGDEGGGAAGVQEDDGVVGLDGAGLRSEERGGGIECVRTSSSGWSSAP